ncbi:MAG TPA: DUF4124 domain-containing protein [Burkholderiales bacterium]
MWRLLALALTLIPVAHAETYRWVDDKGVVTYSNTPPPAAAKSARTVADHLSTYEPDPTLKSAAAQRGPSYYEQRAEREWLQRQRLMAASRAPLAPAYDYADSYYPAYVVGPVFFARPPVRVVRHRGPHRF